MNRRVDNKISAQELEPLELEPLAFGEGFTTNGINKYVAGNERERGPDTPVKLSVVGPSKGNSGIWRRERIRMNEGELDDVAFLTGAESSNGRPPRDGRNVAVCSQKHALCVTAIVLGALLGIALVIAYAGPQSDCPCAGKMPKGYVWTENSTEPFEPFATNGQAFPWLLPFLPSNIKPNRYTILIHPNLTTMEVKGQVSIEFYVEKEMSFIVLHAQNLNITEKALVGPKGFTLKIVRMLEYPPRQQIYIEFRDKLRKKSNYSLNLRWFSKLNPEPEGFYVDEYDAADGTKKLLAATILGAGKARKAYPCFDEPHLRAAFKISLFRDRFHIGLSNSVVHATDDVGFYMGTGLLRDDFVESPPLPPDAIAWVISVFRRELLDSSATYHAKTSTSLPIALTSKSENYISGEKTPFRRNMTSILKKGLFIKMGNLNNYHDDHTTAPVTHKSENLIKEQDNQSELIVDDGTIRTAPSYTFYAPEDVLPKTRFILHTSRDILEHLQQWLNVAYPLSKLDFVALPSIEENLKSALGLISCKTSFLRDASTVTTLEYHNSAIEISEAILQQYFGGLISPKTWKQNWLWEGIIRYLSRLIFSPLQPLWPIGEKYLLETKLKALDLDVLQGWDSVLNGTDDNGENNDFYIDKSAAILTVLHSAMGDENFRSCLGLFLTTYKYSTAEPNDLWQICSKRSNGSKNIKEMMNFWTTQAGFPLLVVNKSNNTINMSQKPFKLAEFLAVLEDPSFDNNNTDDEAATTLAPTTTTMSQKDAKKKAVKWIFPIQYSTSNKDLKDTVWLDTLESKITLKENVKWIKVNSQQEGYYRVLYNKENYDGLIQQLRTDHTVFSAKDRMGLISDVFALCHGNLIKCDVTMDLASYLPKEMSWGPMVTGIKHFEKWRKILKYTECYLLLAEFIKSILTKSVTQIGWTDTGSDEIRLLRPQILLASVLWEHTEAIHEAKTILHGHLTNATVIPPNMRGVAYIGSVLSGELEYWQYCWDRYTQLRRDKDNQDERLELLRALGVTKDAWLQNRLLSFVTTLPSIEIIEVLEAISSTPTGGAMACRFLQAKWFDLQKRFGRGSTNFARVITSITRYGANKFDYDELKSLVDRFGEGPGMQVLSMTLKTVAANVEWISRSQSTIYNWVENYNFS